MSEHPLSVRERRNLECLLAALEAFDAIHSHMTVRTAAMFVRLAAAEGSTQSEIAKRYGLPKTSVNRMVKLMGAKGLRETPGLGLLDLKADDDERAKPVRLSAAGSRLVRALDHIMAGANNNGNS